ncbi:MAG: hypothetical protein ABFS12_15085 [Bacteroidota bacterium]
MKITDEILNKLIDNELNKKEIEELHDLIKHDEAALIKVKTHQMVDSVLKKIDIEAAPEDTTAVVMDRISNSLLVNENKNGFIKIIVSSFVFLLVITIGFLFSITDETQADESPSFVSEIINKFVSYFSSIEISFDSNLMLIIGGALTLLFLISGYFMLEEHKSFKQKLENYF